MQHVIDVFYKRELNKSEPHETEEEEWDRLNVR
jgi:hypothetical protein